MKILIEHGSNVDLQNKVLIFFFFLNFLWFLFHFYLWFIFFGCSCCVNICFIFCFVLFFFEQFFFLLKYGWTALHSAADEGFVEIVKILIEHGSSINLQNQVLISLFFFFDFLFFLFDFSLVCCMGFILVVVVESSLTFWDLCFLFWSCINNFLLSLEGLLFTLLLLTKVLKRLWRF